VRFVVLVFACLDYVDFGDMCKCHAIHAQPIELGGVNSPAVTASACGVCTVVEHFNASIIPITTCAVCTGLHVWCTHADILLDPISHISTEPPHTC
jgi:hypothetical protein